MPAIPRRNIFWNKLKKCIFFIQVIIIGKISTKLFSKNRISKETPHMEGYKNITKIFHVILIYIDFALICQIFPLEKPIHKIIYCGKTKEAKEMFLLGIPYKVTTFIIIIESFLIAHHSITKCGTKTLGRSGNFSLTSNFALMYHFSPLGFTLKRNYRYIYIYMTSAFISRLLPSWKSPFGPLWVPKILSY